MPQLEVPSLPFLEDDPQKLKAILDAFFQNLIIAFNESVPTGTIFPFAGVTLPSGWLLCDGTSYEIEDYKALAKAIGQTFGGTGSQFEVPDSTETGTFPSSDIVYIIKT